MLSWSYALYFYMLNISLSTVYDTKIFITNNFLTSIHSALSHQLH